MAGPALGRPSPTTAKREMVPKFLKKSRFFSVNPAGRFAGISSGRSASCASNGVDYAALRRFTATSALLGLYSGRMDLIFIVLQDGTPAAKTIGGSSP